MNSFVDLTSSSPHGDPDRPERPSSRIRNRRPISISPLEYPQHSVKRRRIDNDNSTGEFQFCDEEDVAIEREEIQSVDLTGVNDSSGLSKIIARQHEDAIRAQKAAAKEPPARSALIAYKCPICMDVAENATTTICGHLFCHKCIIDTLTYSEERRTETGSKTIRGNCPVCRKILSRIDVPGPRRNLIPLQLKFTTRRKTETLQG